MVDFEETNQNRSLLHKVNLDQKRNLVVLEKVRSFAFSSLHLYFLRKLYQKIIKDGCFCCGVYRISSNNLCSFMDDLSTVSKVYKTSSTNSFYLSLHALRSIHSDANTSKLFNKRKTT